MDLSSFVIEFYIYSQIVLTNPFANVPPPPKKSTRIKQSAKVNHPDL